MLKITTITEMTNGLKTVHVKLNGVVMKSFHDEFKLEYNQFNRPVRQDKLASRQAAGFIFSLHKKLGASLGEDINN